MEATDDVSVTEWRVNYSETDQMGVVYHACYLVWLDRARTEHLRRAGMTYAELERRGIRLPVGELTIRYRQSARYDDRILIRCWVEDLASRRIIFGYVVENADTGQVLATAETSLMVVDAAFRWTRLPPDVAGRLGTGHLALGPRRVPSAEPPVPSAEQ